MAKKKAPDKNEHVVIAFFPDQRAAERAADALTRWDDANDEVKLGAYGLLAMMDGKIVARRGSKTGKGAGVGAIMGVIAGMLTDLSPLGGLIAGGSSGGAIGAFMKDSLHMTKEEIAGLEPELSAGKVALVVTCDDFEVDSTQAQLNGSGGEVRNYVVPAKALAAAVEAGVGEDWPSEPFEPEPSDLEPSGLETVERFEPFEPFSPEPTPVAEVSAAEPEFTAVAAEAAAPGPTTAFITDPAGTEASRAEVF